MNRNCDVLLVGQTPPPYHGQSVMTGMLFAHEWPRMEVERVRMNFSDELESVGLASWTKVFRLFRMIWKTWIIVLTKRPEVLYYLPASPNLTPVLRDFIYLAAVKWMFPKTIFHYHAGGLDKFIASKKWCTVIGKYLYGRVDLSIDVNVTEPPSGAYFNSKKNIVVKNGLSAEAPERQRGKLEVFQVLSLGLLCEEKGVLQLVASAAILKKNGVQCEFRLVGDWVTESFEIEVKTLIREQGVEHFFTVSGPLHGNLKWQAYADADMFIFASHHPTETFGLVLVEAMGNRLPIVATRWRGIPHVVTEGESALLCDVKSPEQFANAIRRIADDPDLRKAMGEKGRARYEEEFTKEKFLERMESAFEEVLKV